MWGDKIVKRGEDREEESINVAGGGGGGGVNCNTDLYVSVIKLSHEDRHNRREEEKEGNRTGEVEGNEDEKRTKRDKVE
ncbi:hypothetical protein EYF80_050033 [Liparis tanakae]|uniref:Uncharacterized protein n=1 Tax=Liparis tanakae TaxID=230148 RepID=A0A4Z2FHL2_9TELE|nr:hypothetical protein EYF80_050033 [Liparis tanakae]